MQQLLRASGDKYETILLPSGESTSRRSVQPVAGATGKRFDALGGRRLATLRAG